MNPVSTASARLPALKLRYDADLDALLPRLAERFVALKRDAETDAFLAAAARGKHGFWRTRLHRLLRQFMSDFDANGVLDMYPLFLGSSAHWQRLLGPRPVDRLLDIGAGSGKVTRTLVPCAKQIVATELSRPMARALRRRGFECHELDVAEQAIPGPLFDVVSCLNVLDRTARPQRLLKRALRLLAPNGRLLLGLALPYRPFYYVGATTPEPIERLACTKPTWEGAVNQLVSLDLEPLGLVVQSLARAPYLSFGDTQRGLYELDDVILVAKKPLS